MASLSGIIETTSSALDTVGDAVQSAIDTWLSDTDTVVGGAKHIATGLAAEATAVVMAPLVGPQNKLSNMTQQYTQLFHLDPKIAKYMVEVTSMFQQPNIEGITIFCESEQMTRQMDISEQPLVVQRPTVSTTYSTDNAVPRPREWRLKGQLTTILPTDHYMVLKPSLLLQRAYLDACMKSRRPLWFKTYDNTFVKVLIANMTTMWDPKSMNTLSIDLTLKEFVSITVTEGPASDLIAKFGGALL